MDFCSLSVITVYLRSRSQWHISIAQHTPFLFDCLRNVLNGLLKTWWLRYRFLLRRKSSGLLTVGELNQILAINLEKQILNFLRESIIWFTTTMGDYTRNFSISTKEVVLFVRLGHSETQDLSFLKQQIWIRKSRSLICFEGIICFGSHLMMWKFRFHNLICVMVI